MRSRDLFSTSQIFVTPKTRVVGDNSTDTFAVTVAHRLMLSAMRGSDDSDWPVHCLMLSFHDLYDTYRLLVRCQRVRWIFLLQTCIRLWKHWPEKVSVANDVGQLLVRPVEHWNAVVVRQSEQIAEQVAQIGYEHLWYAYDGREWRVDEVEDFTKNTVVTRQRILEFTLKERTWKQWRRGGFVALGKGPSWCCLPPHPHHPTGIIHPFFQLL